MVRFLVVFQENKTWEAICMEYQILFSMKNKKKYFRMLSAEIFIQHAK